jgi:hypothetical protein
LFHQSRTGLLAPGGVHQAG